MNDDLKKIVKQNEIIISLLGRLAFTSKQVREIVTSKKRENLKQRYINGYNALNGKKSVSDIADIIGITEGTLSPILSQWEELGIIYEIERAGGKFYKRLFPI
jgi:DNA-binding MarR family transcriptional regulator